VVIVYFSARVSRLDSNPLCTMKIPVGLRFESYTAHHPDGENSPSFYVGDPICGRGLAGSRARPSF